jgi:hypothetical protein
MAGVKHCLLIFAVVSLMGCGESKEVVEAKGRVKLLLGGVFDFALCQHPL